jgi:hypothetical protein
MQNPRHLAGGLNLDQQEWKYLSIHQPVGDDFIHIAIVFFQAGFELTAK